MLAMLVTALYHKVFDDTVEEQRVVELRTDQFEEIVTVLGRLVVEGNANVALGGLQ